MEVNDLIRRDLMDSPAYHPSQPCGGVKLDTNESPWGLPDKIRQKLIHWLEDEENLNRYPDSDNTALKGAIAKFWDVRPENVTCGVGSDQLIDVICKMFIEPGDAVVTQKPTFGMYAVSAVLNRGRAATAPVGYDVSAAEAIVNAAALEKAKIIFLCVPNNPTGRGMSEEGVRFVLENARSVVVIDEAYGEFSGRSSVSLIKKYPNMIVLRTFSKAFGLAGARVGYALADGALVKIIDTAKPPFNLPVISQLLALWAMENAGEFTARAKQMAGARDRLYETLHKLDWLDVELSESNFLYIRSERDVAAVLERGGVSARNFGKSGNEYRVRVSIGSDEENKKVSDLLCGAYPK
ncbi:MAG: histidinol-phosphate transaminase [Synergistaceae bacterium]|jgi:histidinol-phosphate aminotransferase|nr:histidinol-phosphate transaminase [Synergistaceae bacterium]